MDTDGGFIHSETSFFHSLRSFREVVVNGGFNFEWNAFESRYKILGEIGHVISIELYRNQRRQSPFSLFNNSMFMAIFLNNERFACANIFLKNLNFNNTVSYQCI